MEAAKKMTKIRMKVVASVVALLGTAAWASPISPAARSVIPSEVQQIISVDFRIVKNSDAALALKAQVLPDNLKKFETVLKGVGINPDRDLESLTFASFRNGKEGLKTIGVASGSYSFSVLLKKMQKQTTKPVKYQKSELYPTSEGMTMTFLDDNVLLLGDENALRAALNARAGSAPGLDSDQRVVHTIKFVETAPVWSVLDQQGSQDLLLSALGSASKIPGYEHIKNRVLGSDYAMNFKDGVKLRLDVLTSDPSTTAELSSLLKMGVLYKNLTATPAQKIALQNMTVNSASSDLQMHFRADPKKFQDLLHSRFFASVSR
jgi:hypothetical protein